MPRTIMIAVNANDHSKRALNCKYFIFYSCESFEHLSIITFPFNLMFLKTHTKRFFLDWIFTEESKLEAWMF